MTFDAGSQVRLGRATLALTCTVPQRVHMLPPDAMLTVVLMEEHYVTVEFEDTKYQMFTIDLLERGLRVEVA